MVIKQKKSLPLPIWAFLAIMALCGLGWMLAFFLVGLQAGPESAGAITGVVSKFGMEVAKALFVGSTAGVFLKFLLEGLRTPSAREVLKENGIDDIHRSRYACVTSLIGQVNDPSTRHVSILGISLRDFLAHGHLSEVWRTILDRLRSEEKQGLPDSSRLRVRLLLLDHRSTEGLFRYKVERPTIAPGGLRADVPIGIKTVQDAIDSIYGQVVSPYLEARLYSHGSFSFVFVTDHLALVEQYLYRDHGRLPSMPTVQFANRTRAHQDLSDSFQTIWDNAKQPDLHLQHVGVSEGIEGAQILNIFRYQDRQALGRRQIECLRTTRRGEEVSIRAITGRFYSQGEALDTIQKISTPDKDGRWVQVRLLLIDPVSSEAILRAITDLPRRASLRDKLISWDWNQHKRTDLYQDLKNTTRKFTELMEGGCKVEVRLSPAAISSAVLLTHSSAFVEQYLYGHSNDDAVVLGGEYPVFEYRLDDKAGVEQRVVRSCFDSVWDSYSMSLEEFRKRNWQEHFEAHHQQLLSSLGPDTLQQGNEAAVKPASARTPETASKPVGA